MSSCLNFYPCIVAPNHTTHDSKKLSAISHINNFWKEGSTGTITISFRVPNISWCHIGTLCTEENPSMNLGILDPPMESFEYNNYVYKPDKDSPRNYYNEIDWIPGGTVIHEFCHALGMLHEHQNNLYKSGIVLDKDSVIDYYKSLGLPKEEAYKNVLDLYEIHNDYYGTSYDRDSIMSYYLPDEWIKKGYTNPTKPNYVLSEKDIKWLEKIYPKNVILPKLYIKFIDGPEWKKAWTTKIVLESIAPIVGIKFIFETEEQKQKQEQKQEQEHEQEQEQEQEHEQEHEQEENTENKEKNNNIIIKNNTINMNGTSNLLLVLVCIGCMGFGFIKYKSNFI
jgi:hypothetical protein